MKNLILNISATIFVVVVLLQVFALKPWTMIDDDTLLQIICTPSFFIIMPIVAFIRYLALSFHKFFRDLMRMQNQT